MLIAVCDSPSYMRADMRIERLAQLWYSGSRSNGFSRCQIYLGCQQSGRVDEPVLPLSIVLSALLVGMRILSPTR